MHGTELIFRLIFCLILLLVLFLTLKYLIVNPWRISKYNRIRKDQKTNKKNDQKISRRTFAKKKLEVNLLARFVLYLTFFVGALVVVYLSNFALNMPSANPAEWGQMGDFFGGMLNPIFAFASFIALLYTIRLQSSELELSRQELSETRQELERSASAQESQLEAIDDQKFDNRFFKLIEMISTEHQRVQQNHFYIFCQRVDTNKTERLKLDFEDFSIFLAQGGGSQMFYLNNNGGYQGPFTRDFDYSGAWVSLRHIVIMCSSRFNQLMDLLNLILEEVDRRPNSERYHSVIKALLDQNILLIIAIWCSFEDVDEYKPKYAPIYRNHKERYQGLRSRIEQVGLLESLVTNTNGDLSVHTPKLNICDLPYALKAYGNSNYMNKYRLRDVPI